MKTMTCRQLGGACDVAFHAESFEEMAELSKQHGKELFRKGDKDHMLAMQKMQERMETPEQLNAWMEEKRAIFNALP